MVATAVIVIGGDPPPASIVAVLPPERFVIAADSGYDHAIALGLTVDLLVGDLDSISAAGLVDARRRGIVIEEHSPDKDATDTELALIGAVERGFDQVVGIFGGGDRLDHALAALFAFAAPHLSGCRVTLWWGDTRIIVLHDGDAVEPAGSPGEPFSLLPLHGPATGVDIVGARYPLTNACVAAGSSLGISNLFGTAPSVVRLGTGTVIHITPHTVANTLPTTVPNTAPDTLATITPHTVGNILRTTAPDILPKDDS